MKKTSFGVLLPHFGKNCNVKKIVESSVKAEKLGFESVWARDHVIFHPHSLEGPNNNFLEPFSVLSAISSVTKDLILGTGTIIPLRHPLATALQFATLSQLSGGRVIAGFGAGNFKVEFDALGYPFDKRPSLVREHIEALKKVLREDDVSFEGEHFTFKDVTMNPKPLKEIPVLYGGATPAAARRAATYCDGWLPGRITLPTFDDRIKKIETITERLNKSDKIIGVIPITSIDKDKETALNKINLHGLLENARNQKWWKKPPSGSFEKAEDLEGSLIAGSPEDCCQEVEKYVQRGVDHLVFDLRFRFDEYDECMTLLADDVISNFK